MVTTTIWVSVISNNYDKNTSSPFTILEIAYFVVFVIVVLVFVPLSSLLPLLNFGSCWCCPLIVMLTGLR